MATMELARVDASCTMQRPHMSCVDVLCDVCYALCAGAVAGSVHHRRRHGHRVPLCVTVTCTGLTCRDMLCAVLL